MIVTEALTVHPLDVPYEHVPFGHRDEIIPPLAQLADLLREGETPPLVLAQLNHTGGQTAGRILRQSPWAPSSVPDVASKKMAREMEAHQIEAVVHGFTDTAERVMAAGLDGVEINAAQYSLLRQFLSPLTNFRGDEHGGSLENRERLLMEVIASIRQRIGPQPLLGVKLCGDELAPWGGITQEDAAALATRVAATGHVNFMTMQPGGPYSTHMTDPGMPIAEGWGLDAGEKARNAVLEASTGDLMVPVMAEGRIEQPEKAVEAIRTGRVDGCVMTRALMSDPEMPRKIQQKDPLIRPHVGMRRYFAVRGDWNRPLSDLANPRAGKEDRLPPVSQSSAKQKVLVIGGGPAGLEAATTLASEGHHVKLLERSGELGGMAAILSRQVETLKEFNRLLNFHQGLLARFGVDVVLNQAVDGSEPWLNTFDRIVLAVGAADRDSALSGQSTFPWFSPRSLLTGQIQSAGDLMPMPSPAFPPTGLAVVVDAEGGFRMAAIVEWLLAKGYNVDVVTEDFFVGRELVESGEMNWFSRVRSQGAKFYPRTRLEQTAGAKVICQDRFSGQAVVFSPVALGVHVQPETPARALWEKLQGCHPKVIRVGDAMAPRLMGEAVQHAHRMVLNQEA